MVNKCSFPNCRSAYDVISKGVNKARTVVSMHKFSNELIDPKRFKIWEISPVDNKHDWSVNLKFFEKKF